jgi:AAA+ superfamily predicted ATPase
MDGYRGEIILVATTNYESLLDKAVLRRFDEVLRFEMPNLEQIKRLLALKISGVRRNFEPDDGQNETLRFNKKFCNFILK